LGTVDDADDADDADAEDAEDADDGNDMARAEHPGADERSS